jgi:hypothetical protein
MFNTPLANVTLDQIVQFCQTFPEGVRVEYKRQVPTDIPKIISSFANTAGGIWVIGVETDPATNMPTLPLSGMPRRPGVEEQIIQSAHTGIYPSITPDVRVFEVEGQPDRIIVVIRVLESIEAPHAIENSTRVYVRVASTTPPYDLADIDRIEYLLKRRQEPERRRETLIAQAAARSPHRKSHLFRVIVAPIYPRGVLIARDTLFDRAEHLEHQGMPYLTEFRRVHEGLMSSGRTGRPMHHHFEVNVYGIAFLDEPGQAEGDIEVRRRQVRVPYVTPARLLYSPALMLNHVIPLYQGTFTNILIRYELFGWEGVSLLPELPGRHIIDRELVVDRHECIDYEISVSAHTVLESLADRRVDVITKIMEQVLWAFNYTDSHLRTHIESLLRLNGLI